MVSMLHRRTLSTMNKGLVCCPVTHTMFEKSHGMARFDSRRKPECDAGGGGTKRREHIYVGPNWITIFLIGKEAAVASSTQENTLIFKATAKIVWFFFS